MMKGPAGWGDFPGLMKQAQKQVHDLQQKLGRLEEELKERVVEGTAGGGMVKVIFNGQQEALDVKIDPSVLKEEEPEFLEEMILAAVRQGLKNSRELAEQEKEKVTGSLNIPGLSGLL